MAAGRDSLGAGDDRPGREIQENGHGRIVAGTVVAGFCVFLQLYAPQPLLALFRKDFGGTEAEVSLIISAATFGVAAASPFFGMVADAVGRKRVIVPSLIVLALATVGCALARNLGWLIAWRLVGGVCVPGVIAVTLAYIAEEAAAHRTGTVTALYVTGTVVGGLTGRLSTALVADHGSWRWAFWVLAAMTLAGAAAVWMVLPRARRFTRQREWKGSLGVMARHLRNGRLLATYVCGFVVLFSHVGLFTYVNFYLARPPFSLSTSALGMVFLVYGLGIVITPLSGRMIDRVGHRAGLGLAVMLMVLGAGLTLAPWLWAVIAGLAVASSGVFVAQASASSQIGRVAEGGRSAASGLYVACYYLGGSVGATALALPWGWAGWRGVVGVVAAMQVLMLIGVWRWMAGRREGERAEVVPVE